MMKPLLLIVVAAVVAALVTTFAQEWISGESSAAVTGGVAGAIGALVATTFQGGSRKGK